MVAIKRRRQTAMASEETKLAHRSPNPTKANKASPTTSPLIREIARRKKLEREVVEIASLEQQRIGQDLHDSVGQELTALNLLAGYLAETFQTDPAEVPPLLERMMSGLQSAQQALRAVLRGLYPILVEAEGLTAALAGLAEHIQQLGRVSCVFECLTPVSIADKLTATHLCLIAQEAAHNAVKHAAAKEIRITLQADKGLVLRIQDDGIGLPAGQTDNGGLGLRIMRNRAAIIGAKLTIEPVKPSGTRVTCVLARD
jgi:signal transduction histidine kinase